MDLQARYGAKSECFERICQRAADVKEEGLVDLVRDEVAQLPPQSKDRLDWEYVVRAKIWDHVAKEGELTSNPESRDGYFRELFLRLDLALVYTEIETCNWQYVLEVLEEVLDGHTVDSCVTIFDWVETRSARLLKGMIPSKGKALVVLRTLNALKARAARTGFAGRILAFQSGIFDITERSGVNLQGELGSTWNGVALPPKEEKSQAEVVEGVKTEGGDAMEGVESTDAKTDSGDKKSASETKSSSDTKPPLRTPDPAEQRRNLYNTFWQLQMYFANPLVFAEGVSAQVAAANGLPSADMKPADVFVTFKKAVDTIVPVLGERTRKDNALMGRESKGSAAPVVGVKRKRTISAGVRRIRDQIDDENAREVELEQAAAEEKDLDKYFFAKFLTSPDLLELELADTNFRRQILFQLMILLKHLLLTIHYSKPPAPPPAPAQPPAQATPMLIPNAKSLAAKQLPPTPQPAPTPAPAPPAPPTTAQLRRKRLMGDIVLPTEDEQWIRRMMTNCLDEWRATGAGSVRELFTREEHWVDWKNNMCSPFEKRDFDEAAFAEQAKKSREDMIFRPLNVWRNPLGSASLTAVWDNKYGGVEDLEDVHRPPSMQKFENMNKAINIQIQRAEAAIAAEIAARNPPPAAQPTPEASANLKVEGDAGTPTPGTPKPVAKPLATLGIPPKPNIPSRPGTPAPPAQPQATTIFARPHDEELPRAPKIAPRLTPKQRMLEDHQLTKTKICWQALRAASLLGHGRVFTQLGVGSVDMLIQEIEKDKKKYDDDRAKRLSAKAEEANKAPQTGGVETVEGEGDKTEDEKLEGGKVEAERAETMEVDA